MRALLIFSIVFSLAAAGALNSGGRPAQGAPQNAFLITIDTLRADHVHCYGYDNVKTPALDGLATQGVLFTQAFTPSPITNTSHTSILTGLLPSSHGVSDFGVPLARSHSTLAELLMQRHYQTAAFIGAVILDSTALAPGLDRGFQFYDNFPEHPDGKSRWGRIERRGMDVALRTEKWLAAHRGGSHFVWMHLYDPHDPYEPPPPYSVEYKDHPYDGEVAYADSALAHLLGYLKKENLYDSALVIVVGDHGEGLGEHHENTHGIFLYDSTTHVPLIVKLPNARQAGEEIDAQVRTMDIMPTVLDLVGIPIPEKLDGQSLKPLFTGDETKSRVAFGETEYPLRFGWAPIRSVRQDGFKFIEAPQPEFYDLHSDPKELRNSYAPWDPATQKLRKTLAESNLKPPGAVNRSDASVSAGTIDELHALGYLGPADAGSTTDVPEPSLLPDPKDKIEEQNLLHTAMIAIEDDRPNDARRALENLLQQNAESVMALSQLGRIELQSGAAAQAAKHFKHAFALKPKDATIALEYAGALEESGDLRGAREAAETSLKLNANQASARLLLGRIHLLSGDTSKAEDEFEAVLLTQPENLEAKLGFAKALMAENKFREAVDILTQASGTRRSPEEFTLLAQAYRKLGREAEAKQADSRAKALQKLQSSH